MKIVKLLFLIFFLPAYSFCQSLTGLWTGSLDKGADPQRKDQSFELNLTEYRGKVYGYSYTTTLIHDTLFYIVKRVKGKINGNSCEIKDDELISCNFMSQDEKDIKKTYSFNLDASDSLWHLDGKWKTNKTKVFYSVTGDIKLSQEKDISKSKLLPHLQELNINDAVAVAPPSKTETTPVKQAEKKETSIAKRDAQKKPDVPPSKPTTTVTNPPTAIAKSVTKTEPSKDKDSTEVKNNAVVTAPVAKENSKTKEPEKKKEDVAVKKETDAVVVPAVVTRPPVKDDKPVATLAAVNVEKRKSITQQVIDFTSDSLTVSLYDNGEIDGDTVSVLVNGEVVMANQGLKATAIKKTIYITPAMTDSFTLVLYAENLGKYPPNTGLMIVRDGEEVYQIRFSADLQKNVAVIFKKKKRK